jgi:mRNA-degrading endonuclease RelE of RelBE toxin-antitoxin system
MFEIQFTPRGQKDFEKLAPDIQRRIVAKMRFFSSQPDPVLYAKSLIDLPPATHRFRVGDYRIAFYLSGKTIVVDRIKHRKEVYQG